MEMKYIHWAYEAPGFEVTEELYHLDKDPLELTNLAANPEYLSALQQMRKTYDRHLADWKVEALAYNNYQPYGIIFDRNKPWAEKEGLYSKEGIEASRKATRESLIENEQQSK